MTDDEILDALAGRLAAVESRLPPRRLASLTEVDRPAVRSRAGTGFGPAAGLLAAVVLLAAAAIVAFGVGGNQPHPSIPASGTPGAAIMQASTSFPPSIAASPSGAALEVIRNETWDGDAVLIQRLRWGPCFVSADAMRLMPDGRLLDEAIDQADVAEGFVTRDKGRSRFWVGPTPESAALGYGSPILVIDRHSTAWIVSPTGYEPDPIGFQLYRIDTPKGRSAWFLGNSFRQVSCVGG
jgi:hypothetical protein